MPVTSSCPGRAVWQSFLHGSLSRSEASHCREHLGQCALCRAAVRELQLGDEVVAAYPDPAQATTGEHEGGTQGDPGTGTLRPPTSLPPENADANKVRTIPSPPIEESGNYGCLAPPEAPGELGRLGGYRVVKM